MFRKLFNRFFGRDNPAGPGNDGGSDQSTATPHSPSASAVFNGIDITTEENFKLLTGIKEEEFIVQVLSAIEWQKSQQAQKPAHSTPPQAEEIFTSLGGPPKDRALFETLTVVKRLRFLEAELTEKAEQVKQKYTLAYYHQVLSETCATWEGKQETSAEKIENITQAVTAANTPLYAALLHKQLAKNSGYIVQDFTGASTDEEKEAGMAKTGAGVQANLKQEYSLRCEIKQEELSRLKEGIETYRTEKAEQVYREYHKANTHFFWGVLAIVACFSMLSLVMWHLLSPYTWEMLPLAFILAGLLMFIPAKGFYYSLRPRELSSTGSAIYPQKATRVWHLTIDLIVPLALVLVILLINWPLIAGYFLPLLLAFAVLLFFLAIRVCASFLLPSFYASYRVAVDKLYEKRAFTKHRREHKKNMHTAELDDYSLGKETDRYIKESLEKLDQYQRKFEELVEGHKAKERSLFTAVITEKYENEAIALNAWHQHTGSLAFVEEIRNLATVKRLLTRLEYLYDLAAGSTTHS